MPQLLYRQKIALVPIYRRLGGPHSLSRHFEEHILLPIPEFKPQTVQPVLSLLYWLHHPDSHNIYIYAHILTYSKIPLIQITWDQTCARLVDIWIIRQHLYSPKVLQVIFCYCSCTWSAQLNKRAVHLDISYTCWFTVSRVLCCVYWSLHRWKGW
jgi:hypothetical protein